MPEMTICSSQKETLAQISFSLPFGCYKWQKEATADEGSYDCYSLVKFGVNPRDCQCVYQIFQVLSINLVLISIYYYRLYYINWLEDVY